MTQVDPAALTFALSPSMTCEDAAKEIYSKTAKSVHPHKMTMQVIIVIAMTWEAVSETGRAIAASAGAAYVPYNLLQYDSMIDRAANAAYLAAVAGGAVPGAPNPYVDNLAEANDEVMSAFENFIAANKWNVVYTTGGVHVLSLPTWPSKAASIVVCPL